MYLSKTIKFKSLAELDSELLVKDYLIAHTPLIPSTSSQTFMKVNRSTFDGITASYAFVKWNSELARVFSASLHWSFVMCPAPFKSYSVKIF